MIRKMLFIILTITVFGSAGFALRLYQKRHFSCYADYYTNLNSSHLKAIFRLVFNGDEGTATLTGEIKDEQGKHLALSRQVLFTFKERSSIYLMQSVKSTRENFDEVDNNTLKQFINAFFYEDRATIQYSITPQRNGDFVIFDGRLPLAYCHQF